MLRSDGDSDDDDDDDDDDGGDVAQQLRTRGLGAAYAGIAVGALAVVAATLVGLRWAARPPVRTLTVGHGRLTCRGATPRR